MIPSVVQVMARIVAFAISLAAVAALSACGGDSMTAPPPGGSSMHASAAARDTGPSAGPVLRGTLPRLNGKPQDLARYAGEVVLVVNTATECGFTPQFEQLERLYRQNRDRGFVILGFPADDVAHQEPRDDAAIAEFCRANFGVSFPMFAKSNVVDDPVNPVFSKLSESLGPPSWNFNKYLLDRSGRPVEHYTETTEPDDVALTARIDSLLRS
jgi:glutathione peroxidase